jgi:predicted house-cleaning noncanonical NTP pyrophosphatase (MazG superfamily)
VPLTVFVLDPSDESLQLAQDRAKQIKHSHALHFQKDWKGLPDKLLLSIVSTSSNIREDIVMKLISEYQVSNLLLEKVLFQAIASYRRIEKLINEKGLKVWVNHARRMMEPYQLVKQYLAEFNEKIHFQVFGGGWGIGCNGLHFLDLLTYITNEPIKVINSKDIDNVIHQSKRSGFVEFSGTISGTTKNGSTFNICSRKDESSPITISILSQSIRLIISENSNEISVIKLCKKNQYKPEISNYEMKFQSELTGIFTTEIIEDKNVNLPIYGQACELHIPFIRSLLKKYNQITGINSKICPIT